MLNKQEIVLLQLDFTNAFDSVDWGFISTTLTKMGFGPRISKVIQMLGEGAEPVLSLNGLFTNPISIKRLSEKDVP